MGEGTFVFICMTQISGKFKICECYFHLQDGFYKTHGPKIQTKIQIILKAQRTVRKNNLCLVQGGILFISISKYI